VQPGASACREIDRGPGVEVTRTGDDLPPAILSDNDQQAVIEPFHDSLLYMSAAVRESAGIMGRQVTRITPSGRSFGMVGHAGEVRDGEFEAGFGG
jgi:hypothetical protein